MRTEYLKDLESLKTKMTEMCELVKTAIATTVNSLQRDDRATAKAVVVGDAAIDDAERSIENLCLKLLLTQQPVASDLRMISSALKMITDMERMGDFAVDIAEIVLCGGRANTGYGNPFIGEMGRAVISMVDEAVRSFTERDAELAKKVCQADDEVDGLFLGAKDLLAEKIRQDESFTERALDLMMVSKYLERIGDHATNVAEWVIYSVTGVHVNTENGV